MHRLLTDKFLVPVAFVEEQVDIWRELPSSGKVEDTPDNRKLLSEAPRLLRGDAQTSCGNWEGLDHGAK